MISPLEVLDWLNAFEISRLSQESLIQLKKIRDPATPDDEFENLVSALLKAKRNRQTYSLEFPEILVNCAVAEIERGNPSEAQKFLQEAINGYARSPHRQAVSLWLQGWVSWELQAPYSAHQEWERSLKLFSALAEKYLLRRSWYQERLVELKNFIEVIQATHLSEAYAWLYKLGDCPIRGSSIRHANRVLIGKMKELSQQGEHGKAEEIIRRLELMAPLSHDVQDPGALEAVELLVECSLIYDQRGNWQEALSIIEKALRICAPGSHERAVVRWLMGILEWQSKKNHTKAIKDWQLSMKDFRQLALQADYRNNPIQRLAYEKYAKVMQQAYEWMIAQSGS